MGSSPDLQTLPILYIAYIFFQSPLISLLQGWLSECSLVLSLQYSWKVYR